MGEFDVAKYAITQGGLLALCLVLFFYSRRDYLERAKDDQARVLQAESDRKQLLEIVEKNAGAMTAAAEASKYIVELLKQNRDRG